MLSTRHPGRQMGTHNATPPPPSPVNTPSSWHLVSGHSSSHLLKVPTHCLSSRLTASSLSECWLDFSSGGGGLVAKLWMTLVTPWTVACQAPLFMGLSWQEYWSGLPFPSPGALPDPGIGPMSPALAGKFLTVESQGSPLCQLHLNKKIKIKEGP